MDEKDTKELELENILKEFGDVPTQEEPEQALLEETVILPDLSELTEFA